MTSIVIPTLGDLLQSITILPLQHSGLSIMRETRYSARQKRVRDNELVHEEPNYKEFEESDDDWSVDAQHDDGHDANTTVTEPPPRKKRATKSSQRDMSDPNDQLESSALVAPKSQRSSRKRQEVVVAVDLDSLGFVMEFLGHRELLTFTSTCKTLRDKLTMSMVVKSAMVTGNRNIRGRFESFEHDLRKRAIYLPSPLRLLRFANAKQCEFCSTRASDVLYRSGLMSCYSCRATLSQESFPRGGPILASDRVLYWGKYDHQRYEYVAQLFEPICVYGERVGPIATVELYQAMIDRMEELPNESISDIIDQVLPHDPALQEEYACFMEAREAVVELAKEAESIRRGERKVASLKAARNRLDKLEPVLEKLKTKLHAEFREFALERHVDEMSSTVIFACPLVKEMLARLVWAPSKVSDAELDGIATKLNNAFRTLSESELVEVKFLSSSDDPFDIQLRAVYNEMFPDTPSLASKLTQEVLDHIKADKLYDALCSIGGFKANKANFGSTLLRGVMKPLVKGSDIDLSKAAGAHWLMCHYWTSSDREVFAKASKTIDGMMEMAEAFLGWAASLEDSEQVFMDHCREAIYTRKEFILIRDGKFEKLLRRLRRSFLRNVAHNADNVENQNNVDAEDSDENVGEGDEDQG